MYKFLRVSLSAIRLIGITRIRERVLCCLCARKYSGSRINSNYEIRRITPNESAMVGNYLRNNYFKDDPVAQALGLAGSVNNSEQIVMKKIQEGAGLMALTTCSQCRILGVGIGSTFGIVENDLTYRLASVTNDSTLKSFLQFLSYMKHLANVPEAIDSPMWDVNIILNDGIIHSHGVGKMLTKHLMVLGNEMGHGCTRIDCASPASIVIAQSLKFRLLWSLDLRNLSKNMGPHSAFSVYVKDLDSNVITQFKRDIEDFRAN